jgi:putative flavoprotein involved in K+ transport
MLRTDTVVIGAGQAGLAASACLTEAGRDHLVLDRGRLAERWRTERWDSLRLLTPNWMSRLPGHEYGGPDPEGFMTAAELVDYLEDYARSFAAPIQRETAVERVARAGDHYVVATDQGSIRADNVVIATGHADVPHVPALADGLAGHLDQLTPTAYRNPDQLADGGVLVVGASASGVQLAEEIRRSGREVVLAVGRHRRMPRRYRGLDIMWWLQTIGAHAQTREPGPSPLPGPSVQLVGRTGPDDLDLATLADLGVTLTGRLTHLDGHRATFADDLPDSTIAAAAGLARLRHRIDEHIATNGLGPEVLEPEPVRAVPTAGAPATMDLRSRGLSTVLWATGFRRRYDWLHDDLAAVVVDGRGELVHDRGVTPSPGLYAVGLWFQHRRDSSLIDGVRHDARHVIGHLVRRGDCAAAAA